MKLGIAVVYLVQEGHGPLLDLHLARIARHTRAPYTIYASTNRLLPQFRDRLASRSDVRLVDCPTTSLRGIAEHSHYLEHLVRAAISDGVTHVVTLHVDSFPIQDGWAQTLVSKLSEKCVLATPPEINTACLLFAREFYLAHEPAFLPPQDMIGSEAFGAFLDQTGARQHSGVGYGWAAHRAGLTWYRMAGTGDTRDVLTFGVLYDELVYHLVGAARVGTGAAAPVALQDHRMLAFTLRLRRRASSLIPPRLRDRLWRRLSGPFRSVFEEPQQSRLRTLRDAALDDLIRDPDAYLRRIRRQASASLE